MLPIYFKSMVISGRGMATKIGIKTANLALPSCGIALEQGVYAGYAFWKKQKYLAAIQYGVPITFDLKTIVLEVHLLDFQQDIYGESLEIEIQQKIREIKKFASINALKTQIQADLSQIRKLLA